MFHISELWDGLREFIIGNAFFFFWVSVITVYLFMVATRMPKNFPPGPTLLPVVGAALFVGRRPEKTFHNWRKKYGDIIGLKMGNEYTVVLNSYELIREALVKHGMVFNDRPNNFITADVLHKSGISMSDYTTNYIKERKFAHATLSRLGIGKQSMETTVQEEARHFVEYISSTNGQLTERYKRMMMNASANIICKVLLGKSYAYQDQEFMKISEGFMRFFRQGSLAYKMTLVLPWSCHLPPVRGSSKAIRDAFTTIDRIMDQKIDEHEATLDSENIRDFIDEYLIQMRNHSNDQSDIFSRKMLKCMARDLFGGAMETILITMTYMTIALTNRPKIQQKVHDEIDKVIGFEGIPNYELRHKMPYTMAVIKEALRWRSVAPLLIAHCTAQTIDFNGYTIPKNTTILPNIYAVHSDPDLWENPDEFIPERHLDANGELNVSQYLLHFGIGPRKCIGWKLAEVELFVFTVSIMQKYKYVPTPTEDGKRPWVPEKIEQTGLVISVPENLPITLVVR